MIALLFHILFSTGFGLIVKDAQVRGRNLWAVGAVNYIVAAIAAWISLPQAMPAALEFSTPTVIIGVFAGVGYVVSYFFLLTVVQRDGISVPMAVVRLAVMIPVLFSIFYWHEEPNRFQIGGIVLASLSLPLLSRNRAPENNAPDETGFRGTKPLIFILFLLTGWCALSPKMFVQVSPHDSSELFLLFLFNSAAIIGIGALIVLRVVPTWGDILPGVLLGLCNIFGNHFFLITLSELPGIFVFPIASSAGVVLNTLIAVTVWREQLRRPVVVGIVISVGALVLINLK